MDSQRCTTNQERHVETIEPLLDEKAVAEILSCSVKTLQKHRLEGRGIPFVKLSKGLVRYRPSDVRSTINASVRLSTSDPGQAVA